MANKRGGLSKREYAAKQAGGTLNYKTGKISVPVKAPVKQISRATASYSMNPEDAPQTTAQYESKIASGLGPVSSVNAAKEEAKLSSSPSKQKGASNRMKAATPISTAQSLANTAFGVPTANASSGIDYNTASLTPSKIRGGFLDKAIDYGTDTLAHIIPGGVAAQKGLSALGIDLSKMLGLDNARMQDSGLANWTADNGQVLGVSDQQGLAEFQNFKQANPTADANVFMQQRSAQRGGSPVAVTGFSSPSIASTRAPRQTTGSTFISPAFTPQASQINPQIGGSFISQPDFTPVDNGQSGTRRQFLGNGMLSNGMASNGKLDSGIEGLSFGAPMNQEEDMINQLLGIKTAQAAETPQNFSFQDNQTPMSAFTNGFANGGLTLDQGYSIPQQFGQANQGTLNPTISDIQNNAGQDKRNIPKPTNTAAQFSQGATGGNSTSSPMMDYQKQQMKGFSAQEKAQKQALNELLKSIKNQYNTRQESGLQDLNKAKQEDLLKLSGLFSFANQDPNSEQRIQYEQRANQDYAGQQSDFLAKLAAAMSGDISQAKQGYQGKLADIAQQKNSAREKIVQLIMQAQQNAQKQGRVSTPAQKSAAYYSPDGSYTFNEVDPVSGLKIFYDPQTNQPFING